MKKTLLSSIPILTLLMNPVMAAIVNFGNITGEVTCNITTPNTSTECPVTITEWIDDGAGFGPDHIFNFTVSEQGPYRFSLNGENINFPMGLWMAEPLSWSIETTSATIVASGNQWDLTKVITEGPTREEYTKENVFYSITQYLDLGEYSLLTSERGLFRQTLANSFTVSSVPIPSAIFLFASALTSFGFLKRLTGADQD